MKASSYYSLLGGIRTTTYNYLLLHIIDTWDDEAVKSALDPNTPEDLKGFLGYCASKTESEKAAWKWVEQNHPHFQFNTVLPSYTVSRLLQLSALSNCHETDDLISLEESFTNGSMAQRWDGSEGSSAAIDKYSRHIFLVRTTTSGPHVIWLEEGC